MHANSQRILGHPVFLLEARTKHSASFCHCKSSTGTNADREIQTCATKKEVQTLLAEMKHAENWLCTLGDRDVKSDSQTDLKATLYNITTPDSAEETDARPKSN